MLKFSVMHVMLGFDSPYLKRVLENGVLWLLGVHHT